MSERQSKLVFAGCSFTDGRWPVERVPFSKLTADILGYPYLHLAASAGSNARSWRVVVGGILDGTITPEDILIVQYTEANREEFWAPGINVDACYNGGIIRAKVNSYKNKWYSRFSEFLRLWETVHLNNDYQLEKFRVMDAMFQAFLQSRGFKNVVFIKTVYTPCWNLLPGYSQLGIDVTDLSKKDGNWDSVNDKLPGYHLTQQGHDEVARVLAEHLRVHFSK